MSKEDKMFYVERGRGNRALSSGKGINSLELIQDQINHAEVVGNKEEDYIVIWKKTPDTKFGGFVFTITESYVFQSQKGGWIKE